MSYTNSKGREYIPGLGRDVPHPQRSHLYDGTFGDLGTPLCKYGFNRDNRTAYSIWRNNVGDKGICKICLKRAEQGLNGLPWTEDGE